MTDELRESLELGAQAGLAYTLAAPARAASGVAGLVVGNQPGASLDFLDHRDYQPGDDLRRIDWSAFGRTDRLVVRLYREEVSPHLDVVLDASRSMRLDAGAAKPRAAVALAALLATAARNAGFTHAVHAAGESTRKVEGCEQPPALWRLPEMDATTTLHDAVLAAPAKLRRRGLRVLVSDLFTPGDPGQLLGMLGADAAGLVVAQVLAADDAQPPQRGNVRLVDSETGATRDVYVDAAVQQRYVEQFERHQEQWRLAARRVGAVFVTFVAEALLETWDESALIHTQVLRV